MCYTSLKGSLLSCVEFGSQAMDSLDLVFRRPGECKVPNAFIPMLFALSDGPCLCFQLPGDELFEYRQAALLLVSLVR